MRAAIYAYAAALDLTMPTLTDQQILECRELIARKGWTVCEDYIRSDYGIAPARNGLLALVASATLNPRPFDCVVMVDRSKLGRTIKVFDVIERFHHSGVSLYFISGNVDSTQCEPGHHHEVDTRDTNADGSSPSSRRPSVKAAIYARYSGGRTSEEQLTACERLARMSGYNVVNPCDDLSKQAHERSPTSKKGIRRANRDRIL